MNDEQKNGSANKDASSPVKAATESGAGDGQNHTAPSSPTVNGVLKNREATENGTAADGDDGTDTEDAKLESDQNEKSSTYSDDDGRKPSIQP